jgi:hypothetical protein
MTENGPCHSHVADRPGLMISGSGVSLRLPCVGDFQSPTGDFVVCWYTLPCEHRRRPFRLPGRELMGYRCCGVETVRGSKHPRPVCASQPHNSRAHVSHPPLRFAILFPWCVICTLATTDLVVPSGRITKHPLRTRAPCTIIKPSANRNWKDIPRMLDRIGPKRTARFVVWETKTCASLHLVPYRPSSVRINEAPNSPASVDLGAGRRFSRRKM